MVASNNSRKGIHDLLSALALSSSHDVSLSSEAPQLDAASVVSNASSLSGGHNNESLMTRDPVQSTEESQPDTTSVDSNKPSPKGDNNDEEPSTEEPSTEKPAQMSDFDKICMWLDQEEWNYSTKPENSLIRTTGTGSNGTFQIVIDLKEADSILIVYVFMPCKVPQNKRLDIAEYTARANYGVMIGNFELDFRDGECRYKGSIDYSGGVLVNGMISELIGKSAYTMNRYFPGMMRVIYGNIDAKSAIAEIEPSQSAGEAGDVLAELLVQAMGSAGEQASSDHNEPTSETPMVIATPTS